MQGKMLRKSTCQLTSKKRKKARPLSYSKRHSFAALTKSAHNSNQGSGEQDVQRKDFCETIALFAVLHLKGIHTRNVANTSVAVGGRVAHDELVGFTLFTTSKKDSCAKVAMHKYTFTTPFLQAFVTESGKCRSAPIFLLSLWS